MGNIDDEALATMSFDEIKAITKARTLDFDENEILTTILAIKKSVERALLGRYKKQVCINLSYKAHNFIEEVYNRLIKSGFNIDPVEVENKLLIINL